MRNVSAHQPRYYQVHWITITSRTASGTWYTHCKATRSNILQNFWQVLVFQSDQVKVIDSFQWFKSDEDFYIPCLEYQNKSQLVLRFRLYIDLGK